MNIVLYATAWGPRHGGVNAFNRHLAIALAKLADCRGRVFCGVVGSVDSGARKDALANGVDLFEVPPGETETFPLQGVVALRQALSDRIGSTPILHIGHDGISGEAANLARSVMGGRSLAIHHMSYETYQSVKAAPAAKTDAKVRIQREIFAAADRLAGVGPLLARRLADLTGRKDVEELVPGLDVFENHASEHTLSILAYGRFDAPNAVIKQAPLVAASFGEASKDRSLPAFANASLHLIGLDATDRTLEDQLKSLADAAAGRLTNILPLPFADDSDALRERLRMSNLACVVSFHEGFGLAAWEAIGAATPLILTRNSGVFELIDHKLAGAGTGCLLPVDIQGARTPPYYTEKDITSVSAAITQVAANIPRAKRNAVILRDRLLAEGGFTWARVARRVLLQDEQVIPIPPPGGAPRPVVARASARNPLRDCVEMTLSTTQGSDANAFDIVPEVRFGMTEIDTRQGPVQIGVRRATLRLSLLNCTIIPGLRLGDDAASSPNVAARPGNAWDLTGPIEDGVLTRSVLGHERVCCIAMTAETASLEASLKCRKRDLKIHRERKLPALWNPTQKKVIELFLAKCLTGGDVEATLSIATMDIETSPP